MQNVRIKEIAVYHPAKIVNNDFYIEHFKNQPEGKDITNFLKIMGRKDRYLIGDANENTITMAVEATKRVLDKAGLEGKDIDMLIFSTQVPEQTLPTNAMFLHNAIQGKKDMVIFDSNANCAGMMLAVEQASRYMMSSPHVNKALVVGSDYLSLIANPDTAITYANFGDASSAVILEKTEEDTGFIDAIHEVDSSNRNNILYPTKGFSKAIKQLEEETGFVTWLPFDGAMALPSTYAMFRKLVERNQLKIEDINHFCLSQFALTNIEKIQETFEIPNDKITFVGDIYGYTGTSSPFIALYEGVKSGKIKRGDTLLFWTIGGGHELIAMLFKY